MDKEFIAMGELICPVCNVKHSHNAPILIDKRLRNIPEDKRTAGYGMCEEHAKLRDEGFVALVEISGTPENGRTTGNIAHIKEQVFLQIFDTKVPAGMVCYVEIGIIEKLKEMNGNTGNG